MGIWELHWIIFFSIFNSYENLTKIFKEILVKYKLNFVIIK